VPACASSFLTGFPLLFPGWSLAHHRLFAFFHFK
jgi:hypothetical protein